MKKIWDEKNTCGFADVRVSTEWSKHGGFDGVVASGGGLVIEDSDKKNLVL